MSLHVQEVPNDWRWLEYMPKLRCLRIQGGQLTSIPPPLVSLPLTRLSLNCTHESLAPGTWLDDLHHLHLGGNKILTFPRVLRQATSLRALHLANQRDNSQDAAVNLPQRLRLSGEDVTALLTLPNLHTVVMNMNQPIVSFGAHKRDFDYLQRVLPQPPRA